MKKLKKTIVFLGRGADVRWTSLPQAEAQESAGKIDFRGHAGSALVMMG